MSDNSSDRIHGLLKVRTNEESNDHLRRPNTDPNSSIDLMKNAGSDLFCFKLAPVRDVLIDQDEEIGTSAN